MKNYELLDMIGDVDEDYVQAADGNTARPRFRWRAFAACAACAALIAAAYPASMAFRSGSDSQDAVLPLHAYILVEGGTLATYDESLEKIPAGGAEMAPGASAGEEGPVADSDWGEDDLTRDGDYYEPGQDVSVQEAAAAQYNKLCRHIDMDAPPEWFAGAWLSAPDQPARLAVAIVNGFRTPELEAQIVEWTGGEEVLFQDAKYSMRHLNSLMDPVVQALDGTDLCCGIGVDVTANCLSVDLYSDGTVPDHILAELARLDPDGDAIQVRVFAGMLSAYDEAAMKEPAPGGAVEPEDDGTVNTMPACTETGQPAQYDTLPRRADDLPQAKYDVITEGE